MKKLLLTLSVMAMIVSSCDEKKEENGEEKEKKEETTSNESTEEVESTVQMFGAEITEEDALNPEEFLAEMAGKDSAYLKVTSTVNSVCQKKGCWMRLDLGEGKDMQVRFKDYEFFVPKDCDGQTAFIEGWAFVDTISVEMQKHYLEDAMAAGEEVAQEEIDAITEPKVELAFMADGVILKDNE